MAHNSYSLSVSHIYEHFLGTFSQHLFFPPKKVLRKSAVQTSWDRPQSQDSCFEHFMGLFCIFARSCGHPNILYFRPEDLMCSKSAHHIPTFLSVIALFEHFLLAGKKVLRKKFPKSAHKSDWQKACQSNWVFEISQGLSLQNSVEMLRSERWSLLARITDATWKMDL